MDPRVKTSTADLTKQLELSKQLYAMRRELIPIGKQYDTLVTELGKVKEDNAHPKVRDQMDVLHHKLADLADPAALRAGQPLAFNLLAQASQLFRDLQQAAAAPTTQQTDAVAHLQERAAAVPVQWKSIQQDVEALNRSLSASGGEPIKLPVERSETQTYRP